MEMWDGYIEDFEDRWPDEDTASHALVPSMRDPMEMRALHLQRLRELEEIASRPEKLRPCQTCRYSATWRCSHPLITGFDKRRPRNMDHPDEGENMGLVYALCGPERGLWAPVLTIRLRIKEFFQILWLKMKGEL